MSFMHPSLIGLLVSAGVLLLLFSRELFAYLREKLCRRDSRKCPARECGEYGWTIARQDAESCHALCIKCGWLSHFDSKEWLEVTRR
jgi:hypothetical protein